MVQWKVHNYVAMVTVAMVQWKVHNYVAMVTVAMEQWKVHRSVAMVTVAMLHANLKKKTFFRSSEKCSNLLTDFSGIHVLHY